MLHYHDLKESALAQILACDSLDALENVRLAFLGKKGQLSEQMKLLGQMSPEDRSQAGALLNVVKEEVLAAFAQQKTVLENRALAARLATETLDITLPTPPAEKGRIHPLSQTIEEVTAYFLGQGFLVEEGPDVEDDFHNFTALNIPADHPARQEHDTFYIKGHMNDGAGVLRTHTSPVQIRAMQGGTPPFRMIVTGRVFRSDYDITHTPMFHQCEGLVIDKAVHMGHLKKCLKDFLESFFDVQGLPLRFRPSFFPFTEPSAEVDMGCSRANNQLKIGAGADWLEILGCGMVHPNVLKNVGLDPDVYQGFAFGVGLERLAMLKYGIPDLRQFYESDKRWLAHYGFDSLSIPSLLLKGGAQ